MTLTLRTLDRFTRTFEEEQAAHQQRLEEHKQKYGDYPKTEDRMSVWVNDLETPELLMEMCFFYKKVADDCSKCPGGNLAVHFIPVRQIFLHRVEERDGADTGLRTGAHFIMTNLISSKLQLQFETFTPPDTLPPPVEEDRSQLVRGAAIGIVMCVCVFFALLFRGVLTVNL